MINARDLVGSHDILFITLDTLRYDVAQEMLTAGCTPTLASMLPPTGWEARHSPGSFTYAAHHAFFAGFLPTPAQVGSHPRLFAARFPGSETTTDDTFVFDAPDIVSGLASLDYKTICIGGVGFFNKQSPLGCVLPDMFSESYWQPEFGVTDARSTEHQVKSAVDLLAAIPQSQRVLLFLNVSAIHQPNYFYVAGAQADSRATHAAALCYVDTQLPTLFAAMRRHGPALSIVCSDHGTAYGEDGYVGHRLAHPVVWTVPYAEVVLPRTGKDEAL